MVSSINGYSSLISSTYSQSLEKPASPEEKSSVSGQIINADEAMISFDSDNDGSLSQSELDGIMQELMDQFGTDNSEVANPAFQQALAGYAENSGTSQISRLISQLGSRPAAPPDSAEKFDDLDADDNGAISTEELETMASEIYEMSGTTIDAEEYLAEYDSDEDGELSEAEMSNLMTDLQEKLGPPPNEGEQETMADVFSSYLETEDEDTISGLVDILTDYLSAKSTTTGTVNLQV